MATQTLEVAPPAAEPPLFERAYRLSVDQYHRMGEAGILGPDDRVELLEGLLVVKMSKNPGHILATDLFEDLLHRLVPAGFFTSMGNPVTIEVRNSEPEPDAQVVRGNPRDYTGRRRGPQDSALVVEVADSSYATDRRSKLAIYAAARVPIYLLLDLNGRRLEAFSDPIGEGQAATYQTHRIYGPDEEVPLILDGREVARFFVRDVLP